MRLRTVLISLILQHHVRPFNTSPTEHLLPGQWSPVSGLCIGNRSFPLVPVGGPLVLYKDATQGAAGVARTETAIDLAERANVIGQCGHHSAT